MNYEAYRRWRDVLLATRTPRRLDCMNPEAALAHLRPSLPAIAEASLEDTVAVWQRAAGVVLPPDRRVVGSGVRAILEALFAVRTSPTQTVWLPQDVYPVYQQLAAHLSQRAFSTISEVDWSFLAQCGPHDLLLLPNPLSPLGRALSRSELAHLSAWTRSAPGRLLVLDHAYRLDAAADALEASILDGDRTISIWSLSKPWLSRGLLGMARVPPSLRAPLQARLALPEQARVSYASALITAAPDLPGRLASRFSSEWSRLAPFIRAACPTWTPPSEGYFTVLPATFEALLEQHDLLTIPATVFGATRASSSIATCLHEIQALDRAAASS